MKRIALFCDGTWNHAAGERLTNVVKLRDLLAPSGRDGIEQLSFYLPGVGAREDLPRGLPRLIDRFGGGAFGWGLTANIEAFYRKLASVYEPGDQVYIFGFSRGAYTARSLAGLIRTCGIPDADAVGSIPAAIQLYRARDIGEAPELPSPPDRPRAIRFRAEFSPRVATSLFDWEQRPNPAACHLYRTAYLGVWDTVGALGVPAHFTRLARLFNRKHRFHDTALSSSVASARHAIAIDETRRTFPPVPWENLDALNARFPSKKGEPLRYDELWFPGVHGAVGGAGTLRGLSDATLYWIAKGAERQGLCFRPELEDLPGRVDPGSPVTGTMERPGVLGRLLAWDAAPRDQLMAAYQVSILTHRRLRLDPRPRDWLDERLPQTLWPVIKDLSDLEHPGTAIDT